MRKINTTRSFLLACGAGFKVPSPQVAIVKALNIALVPSSGNQKYHTHKYAYLYLHRTLYLLDGPEPSVLLYDHNVRRHILLLVRRCLGHDSAVKEPACQWRRHRRRGFDPWVTKIPWRRKWKPIPVYLCGESHGQKGRVGYSPQGHKESDTTEVTALSERELRSQTPQIQLPMQLSAWTMSKACPHCQKSPFMGKHLLSRSLQYSPGPRPSARITDDSET